MEGRLWSGREEGWGGAGRERGDGVTDREGSNRRERRYLDGVHLHALGALRRLQQLLLLFCWLVHSECVLLELLDVLCQLLGRALRLLRLGCQPERCG